MEQQKKKRKFDLKYLIFIAPIIFLIGWGYIISNSAQPGLVTYPVGPAPQHPQPIATINTNDQMYSIVKINESYAKVVLSLINNPMILCANIEIPVNSLIRVQNTIADISVRDSKNRRIGDGLIQLGGLINLADVNGGINGNYTFTIKTECYESIVTHQPSGAINQIVNVSIETSSANVYFTFAHPNVTNIQNNYCNGFIDGC